MPNNDDYGFWDADLDWSRPTPSTASRTHRPEPHGAARVDRNVTAVGGREQPRFVARRLGALAAVGLVAVSAALVVRGTDSNERITSADAADATFVAPTAGVVIPTLTTVAPTLAPTPVAAAVADLPAASVVAVAGAKPTETYIATPVRSAVAATPVVETKRTCAISYTVRRGDYWISIAKRSSVKLADLLATNGARTSTALYAGRTVCLPANATMPAAPSSTVAATTATTAKPTASANTASTNTGTTTKPKPTVATAPPTTAPPTTAAPSTTAAPPRNAYSKAEVEQIIRNVWPDDLENEAVRIATRESNLIPTVRNWCCYGLFQIYFTANRSSLASWGVTSPTALYDAQTNAYVAYAMYLRAGGWGPWSL